MRIGIYAIAKNEAANVARWAASCAEADVRVVTDTGSTDGTPERLMEAGVDVRHGAPVPWRWDDAHTLSLMHLPADVDVAIRLDLDEALAPGWREVVEREWAAGCTRLRCRYEWQPGEVIWCERIHARSGFRWRTATHEWLCAWDGSPQLERSAPEVLFVQRRQDGKVHRSDLELLEAAAREDPRDARTLWYLARELGFAGKPAEEQAAAWDRYLATPGGTAHEHAFAWRALADLRPAQARRYLLMATCDAPEEPEAYLRLAADCQAKGDPAGALYWSRFACQCPPGNENHASEHVAYTAAPCEVAVQAAIQLGRITEAVHWGRLGMERAPEHAVLAEIVADLTSPTAGPRC